MPTKPQARCTQCRRLHAGVGKCPQCRAASDSRPSSSQRGYNNDHRKLFRAEVIKRDPICVICGSQPSTHADHYPFRRDELIEMDLDPNDPTFGRGLCASCDSRQTAQREHERRSNESKIETNRRSK